MGERVPIAGTPFSLNYRSDRAPGRIANFSLRIPLSGPEVPAGLRRIELEIRIAGQAHRFTYPAAPDQSHLFTWDGRDAYGRQVQGRQKATSRIGYVYGAVFYTDKPAAARSFGRFRGRVLETSSAFSGNPEFVVWQEQVSTIGVMDARARTLGGFTLNVHHAYDSIGEALHLGDGGRRSAQPYMRQVVTTAGVDTGPEGFAQAPDGNLYVASTGRHRIVRIEPGGAATSIAGTGSAGCGGPATASDHRFSSPAGLAPGPGGFRDAIFRDDLGEPVVRRVPRAILYVADTGCHQIHEIRPSGGFLFVHTIAGDGVPGFDRGVGGDEVSASAVRFNAPRGLAVGPDGSLYVADTGNHRVRRIAPGTGDFLGNGTVTTVAGNGTAGAGGDGGFAVQAHLNAPTGLFVGPDGSVYIADTGNHRIRRVGPDGIIVTIAGTGVAGFGGDEGPATDAHLRSPRGVAFARNGTVFVSDTGNHRLRQIVRGTITTLAGGPSGLPDDNLPPAQARVSSPGAIALPQPGLLLYADIGSHRVRRMTSAYSVANFAVAGTAPTDFFIPADTGDELYRFDEAGRHVATLHGLTGAARYTFSYDGAGCLMAITDGGGNATTIERDGDCRPTAIVSPFGQRTGLTLDAGGHVATIAGPEGQTHGFTYHGASGLLATYTDPREGVSRFTYDPLGYLTRAESALGRATTLVRAGTADGFEVVRTTPGNQVTTYRVEALPNDEGQRWTTTFPAGTRTEVLDRAGGKVTIVHADGTSVEQTFGPDPRWGMLAPMVTSVITTTPAGLTSSVGRSRTAEVTNFFDPLSLVTLTETITANGLPTTTVYDAATRTFTVTTPEGRQRMRRLDEKGRLVESRRPGEAPIEVGYDDRGRPRTLAQGSGDEVRTITRAYTPEGFLARLTDPLSRMVAYEHDAAGRPRKVILPDGREVGATWDAGGNLASLTPPGRPAHVVTHTPLDLIETYIAPDAGAGPAVTHYTYDADRRMDVITRPDGSTIDYGYDPAGRLASMAIARGQVGVTYHPTTGHLAAITAPDGGSVSLGHDGFLPIDATLSGAVAGTVRHTYGGDFRLASETVNGGHLVTFQYDGDGLLLQAGAFSATRDPASGRVVATAAGNVSTSHGYNAFGEPVDVRVQVAGADVFVAQHTRDRLGRIASTVETIAGVTRTVAFAYDDLTDRLREVTRDGVAAATYTYDANGNRTGVTRPGGSVTATYDAQDRLVQSGSSTYAYRASGALQSRTTGGQTTTYDYDALGNLLRVVRPGAPVIEYVVDGRNRRIGKRVGGALLQGFVYKGERGPLAELDGTSAVVSRFVYGVTADVPEYMTRGGHTYRIVTDTLGSPRLVIDTATGAIAQRMDYDEFGNVTLDTNPGFQPFGFAGGLYDRDTGLVRFGARDYDPQVGRWTAKDPIGFAGLDTNLYAYVFNDPVNLRDPDGKLGFLAYLAIAAAVGLIANHFVVVPVVEGVSADRASRQLEPAIDPATQKPLIADDPNSRRRTAHIRDAYKHCVWQCNTKREASGPSAWFAGWCNENDDADSPADYANNAVGRRNADTAQTDADCKEKCLQSLNSGELDVTNN